jgi:hypothetical protein
MSRPLMGLAAVAVLALAAMVIGGNYIMRTCACMTHVRAKPGQTVTIPGGLTLKLTTYRVHRASREETVRAVWIVDNPSGNSTVLDGVLWAQGPGGRNRQIQPAPELTLAGNSQRIVFLPFRLPVVSRITLGYDNGGYEATWSVTG